ncbi:hypothetical protein NECAME_10276 [Necator americanus]|uniref:Spindle assembly checkpoint component MAD1 n=1 Tax=Necator americanus TaxID=51031 RepID=W2TC13_NECAM|nr:hypothetical protein NECAME_10276 [Necator americanus]ETN78542.1 hypothetical protein NECAME_10276 [Necator americanus]
MIRGRTQSSSDDDDEPSEATMQLNPKLIAQFRKAFPSRDESAKKVVPVATPSLVQISKRLTFDDSFSLPSMANPNVKILELKEEVDFLKRQLSVAENEIKRLKAVEMDGKDRTEKLHLEIVDLKKELIRKNRNTSLDETICSRDEWRNACTRFYRYFQCAKARLLIAENEMRSKGLLCDKIKLALTSAWASAEYNTEEIRREDLDEFLQKAASSLEELNNYAKKNRDEDDEIFGDASVEKDHFDVDKGCDLSATDTAMIAEGDHSIFSNMSESILNSTIANTSIDYEKDERIQRLELENSQLKDRLTILFDRAQKSMLMEEKKNSAEEKYHLLEKKMEEMLSEQNSFRSACVRKLFGVYDTASENRAAEIMKQIEELTAKSENLEEDLERARADAINAKNDVELLTKERDILLGRIDHLVATTDDLRKSLKCEKDTCFSVNKCLEEKTARIESLQLELKSVLSEKNSLDVQLSQAHEKLKQLELELRNAGGESTDAGDETQILHLRNNPLQCAVEELRGEVERGRLGKRKAGEVFLHDELSEIKRARDEHLHALEAQLKKSEREKKEATQLQVDLAKKYREISTTLTGYQIKMIDEGEGICYVNSVYDEMDKQFVFKYNAETGIVDLLDVDQDVLSQGRLWENEMQKYIGERHSIPAFLAAVTLQLEARRNLEDVERTDTFSLLHQD